MPQISLKIHDFIDRASVILGGEPGTAEWLNYLRFVLAGRLEEPGGEMHIVKLAEPQRAIHQVKKTRAYDSFAGISRRFPCQISMASTPIPSVTWKMDDPESLLYSLTKTIRNDVSAYSAYIATSFIHDTYIQLAWSIHYRMEGLQMFRSMPFHISHLLLEALKTASSPLGYVCLHYTTKAVLRNC